MDAWRDAWKSLTVLVASVLLVGCASAVQPTAPATQPPRATPTTAPHSSAEGALFFDMNANGVRDGAAIVLAVRRDGELPKIIRTLFPEVTGKTGDVVIVDEPALQGFEMCATNLGAALCDTSDANGEFALHEMPVPSLGKVHFAIRDPNASDLELAMTHTSELGATVVAPGHTVNDIAVPQQTLHSTYLVPLAEGAEVGAGGRSLIGLTQGYLTLPFFGGELPEQVITWNGFDVCGERVWTRDEVASDFLGVHWAGNPYLDEPTSGQLDSHSGLDFAVPLHTFVVASIPGTAKTGLRIHSGRETGELYVDINNQDMERVVDNGHLGHWLVQNGDELLRGQILAESGRSGRDNIYMNRLTPQLHWDIAAYGENLYLNPFATLSKEIYPKNCKLMMSENLWTVYNTMVFP